MPLSSKRRRELAARGHHLKTRVHLSGGIDAEQVERVRAALAETGLLKVRIAADDRAACEQAAAELAARVPCEFVQRVGRVVLLYRPGGESERA